MNPVEQKQLLQAKNKQVYVASKSRLYFHVTDSSLIILFSFIVING